MFPNPQDALTRPRRPNVERYRKLAKELVNACHSNEPDAIADWSEKWIMRLVKESGIKLTRKTGRGVQRWIDEVTEFATRKLPSDDVTHCRLADAQLVLAESHGFQTWTGLIRHMNGLNTKSSKTATFEAAADAIVAGDIKTLKRLLQTDPALVRVRSQHEHRATLLHYVSANGVEGYRQRTPRNIVKITKLLIDAGAEVDAEADVYGGRRHGARSRCDQRASLPRRCAKRAHTDPAGPWRGNRSRSEERRVGKECRSRWSP